MDYHTNLLGEEYHFLAPMDRAEHLGKLNLYIEAV